MVDEVEKEVKEIKRKMRFFGCNRRVDVSWGPAGEIMVRAGKNSLIVPGTEAWEKINHYLKGEYPNVSWRNS